MSYLAIGNDQLDKNQMVSDGDLIWCKKCKKEHVLQSSTDSNGKKSDLLLFYSCGKHDYLYAIKHRKIIFKGGKCEK